jgi:hypothetical protein
LFALTALDKIQNLYDSLILMLPNVVLAGIAFDVFFLAGKEIRSAVEHL